MSSFKKWCAQISSYFSGFSRIWIWDLIGSLSIICSWSHSLTDLDVYIGLLLCFKRVDSLHFNVHKYKSSQIHKYRSVDSVLHFFFILPLKKTTQAQHIPFLFNNPYNAKCLFFLDSMIINIEIRQLEHLFKKFSCPLFYFSVLKVATLPSRYD